MMWRARKLFSNVWKTGGGFFPHCGKKFSTLWKIFLPAGLCAVLLLPGGCRSVRTSRVQVPDEKHWTLTASSFVEGFAPEQILDDRLDTWWRSEENDDQWLEVDMGRSAMVCGFSFDWADPPAVAYSVLTSQDGLHWAVAFETATGDGGWDQVVMNPVAARYLRLNIHKSLKGTGVALATWNILGLWDQPVVTVNGVRDPGLAALQDRRETTVWSSPSTPASIWMDLRREWPIGSLRLDWGAAGFASNVTVMVSTNQTDWEFFGALAAQGDDFDVLMGKSVQSARYVKIDFENGSAPDGGFAVAELIFRGEEGQSRPWNRLVLAAEKTEEGIYPDVLRQRQVYWTVAGHPDAAGQALLNEEGAVAVRADAPALWPLLLVEDKVWPVAQADRVDYRLGGGGTPMPELTARFAQGLNLRIRVLVHPENETADGEAWIQYDLWNDSPFPREGRLCLVFRPISILPPWAGGGLAPLHYVRTAVLPQEDSREIWGNGKRWFSIAAPDGFYAGAARFRDGDATRYLLRTEWPEIRMARDEDGLASVLWGLDFSLEPDSRIQWVVQADESTRPARQQSARQAAFSFDEAWEKTEWQWQSECRRYALQVARPDAMDCLHAQIGWVLNAGHQQAQKAMESSFFDGGHAMADLQAEVAALFRAGQPGVARQWILRAIENVAADGAVPVGFHHNEEAKPVGTPLPHPAAHGQLAFMMMEDYRFTQDAVFLNEQYPVLRKTLAYLAELRKKQERIRRRWSDEESAVLEGLIFSGETPLDYAAHYWVLLAWKEGRLAAGLLGLEEDAAWMDEEYRVLKADVRRSLRNKMDGMAVRGIPTGVDNEQPDLSALAWLFWPCEEIDLVEPHELQNSLDIFYQHFLGRRRPDWRGRASAEELRLLVPLSRMGRNDYAREILYDWLGRRVPTGWHGWGQMSGRDIRQPGVVGWMPSRQTATDYITALRSLLVREEGRSLQLFCGAPPEWLQHGNGIHGRHIPTQFGLLDIAGYWHKDRFNIEIGGNCRPPEGYTIWWPRQIAPIWVTLNGRPWKTFDAVGMTIPHDFKGTVDVQFPFNAPWPRDP